MTEGIVARGRRQAVALALGSVVAAVGMVTLAPAASAHDPAVAAALALDHSRVALHPALLKEVGYPLYHRMQRMVGDRPVFVIILPSSSDRLGPAREIERAAGRPGVYLRVVDIHGPQRVVDVRGSVPGNVTDNQVSEALVTGVDPAAGARERLVESVVAAVDGRPVAERAGSGGRALRSPTGGEAALTTDRAGA